MTPADHIRIDAVTALVVFGDDDNERIFFPAEWVTDLDRPCDTCGGDGALSERTTRSSFLPRSCDGTGRHTFTVEAWLCDVYDCAKCIGGVHKRRDTLTVHVIDVLPIVAKDIHGEAPDRYVYVLPDGRAWLVETDTETPITLPPAAAPGMLLVRLAVHS